MREPIRERGRHPGLRPVPLASTCDSPNGRMTSTCLTKIILQCAVAILSAGTVPSLAAGQSATWKSIGTMDCTIGTSIGATVGARQHARCEFKPEDQSASSMYFGRLERTGRRVGLPAGAKLMWTIFAPTGDAKTVSGGYRLSPAGPQFEGRDAYALCQPRPNAICLRPLPADVHWKPNFAAMVSAIGFESNLGQRRSKEVRR
jgi:hypothetical protein